MPSPIHIAIVGSGPSGCYLAQALRRALPHSQLTIFDRLPTPYGLLRYGVAADHQHTKTLTRQFDRLFHDEAVRFLGNVEVTTAPTSTSDNTCSAAHSEAETHSASLAANDNSPARITLSEVQRLFDIVVLASGLSEDRRLNIPGDALPGVFGAGALTRILNSHPEAGSFPELGQHVVIVGAGNVALDVLRFLVKDKADYAGSDINAAALESYLSEPAAQVTLLSRSEAASSKGDPQMIAELATLPRARYQSASPLNAPSGEVATADRAAAKRIEAFRRVTDPDRPSLGGPAITLRFGTKPIRILGDTHVTGIEIEGEDGTKVLPASAVITAIGFTATGPLASLTATPETSGRIAPGLYRVGWAKRGSHGAIPENRACAKQVADEIVADIASGAIASDGTRPGGDDLPAALLAKAVDYDAWLRIDALERASAAPGRVREKLREASTLLATARGGVH